MKAFILMLLMLLSTSLLLLGCASSGDTYSGLSFKKSLPIGFKPYGYAIVSKADGYPVREGEKSMRFEVRPGDCGSTDGWSDCKNDRERHELISQNTWSGGEHWFHWSIFIPNDFPLIFPVKVALAQFHQQNNPVVWMFQNAHGGYHVDNQTEGYTIQHKKILTDEEMRGQWSDILVHVKWTHNPNGFFRVYVNGETSPRYAWTGKTKKKGAKVYYKLGVYRAFISRRAGKEPTQIVYYDEVKRAKTCEETTRYFDCGKITEISL